MNSYHALKHLIFWMSFILMTVAEALDSHKPLTYESENLSERLNCHYCTETFFNNDIYVEKQCKEQNPENIRSIKEGTVVYKPWCREARNIGFVRNCTKPNFPNGNLFCPKGNLVYKTCYVQCTDGYAAESPEVECLENGNFRGHIQCVPKETSEMPSKGSESDVEMNNDLNATKNEAHKAARADSSSGSDKTKIVIGCVFTVLAVCVLAAFIWYKKWNVNLNSESRSPFESTSTLSASSLSAHSAEDKPPLLQGVGSEDEDKQELMTKVEIPETAFPELTSDQLHSQPLLQGFQQESGHGSRQAAEGRSEVACFNEECPPPPPYTTFVHFPSLDSCVTDNVNQEPFGTSACDETDPKTRYEVPGEALERIQERMPHYGEAERCQFGLSKLTHDRNYDQFYLSLKWASDVQKELEKYECVHGLALAILNVERDEINHIVGRSSSNHSPFDALFKKFCHHNKKLGHLVMYFSQETSKRCDILQKIKEIHPECPFCTQYYQANNI